MRAIDMHVHVPRQPGLPEIEIEEHLRSYFRLKSAPEDADEMAATYRDLDLLGVIFSVDTETTTGEAPDSNDYVADIVRKYPEQFIGFATVDPWKGKAAVLEVERSVTELGLKGLKLHPIHQAFFPNDTRFYPLYQKCADLGAPVLLHSGFGAAGAGMPGGGGLKLKYAAPIPGIDDIAADFPDLTIIMAHPAWPWGRRADRGCTAQTQRLPGPFGVVAKVHSRGLDSRDEHPSQRQGPLRLRLPLPAARALARRMGGALDPRRGSPEGVGRQRQEGPEAGRLTRRRDYDGWAALQEM